MSGFEWQKLPTASNESAVYCESDRLKVPGGWIVRSFVGYSGSSSKTGCHVVQTFVQDPDHLWEHGFTKI